MGIGLYPLAAPETTADLSNRRKTGRACGRMNGPGKL
jgi:hypothetical protein